MKAILKNESEFAEYVDGENMIRCKNDLVEQFDFLGDQEDYYMVNAGEGYSVDRVFLFTLLHALHDDIVFEFIGSSKG